jgi:hypothetical protein
MALLCRDTSLEGMRLVIVSPYNFEVFAFATRILLACEDMPSQSMHVEYDDYMQVTKQSIFWYTRPFPPGVDPFQRR